MKSPEDRLNRLHLAVVAAIASILILGQCVVQRSLVASRIDGKMFNLAARQRVLSEDVVNQVLLIDRRAGDKSETEQSLASISQSVQQIRKLHRGMRFGDTQSGIEKVRSQAIADLLTEMGPMHDAFCEEALALEGDDDPATRKNRVEKIVRLQTTCSASMDELAYRFYDAASKNTNRTRFLDAALVMATLLILGCEIFFVFRPTSRKIRETIALLRESANASKVSEQQQRDLIHHSATPIICLHSESGRIIHANPSAITKLGAVTDSIVGRRFRTYLTSSSLDTYNDHLAILSEIDQTQCHLTIDRGYETREWMANLTSYQTEDNQTHVLINADDITEQKHREQELLEAKQRDGLTGLYTRREFDRRIMELSRDHQLSGMPFALAMIDVDHFKTINDSYGHVGGDEVLRRLAQMIQSACRQADMVARYGGEEIAILFPSLASDQAMKVSERIRATLEASVISIDRLEDGSFGEEGPMVIRTTISVGVAAAPTHASDPLRLVQAADEALYEAKQNGRNLVVEHGRTFKRKSDADELIAAVY